MPSPRKEYWLGTYGRRLGAPFIMGVGGSIDVLAGHVRRAPVLVQRLGLEWLFRLAQEPRRMFPRYLSGNTRFIVVRGGRLRAAPPALPDAQRRPGGGVPTSSHSSATSVRQSQRSALISASSRAAARHRATPAVAAASQTTEIKMRRRADTASGPRAVPEFNARATESLCQFRYASRRRSSGRTSG